MNKKIIVAWIGALAVFATAAQAQDGLSKGDQRILTDLAQANVNEISAGQIAQQKASSQEVKSFAQQMVDDHSKGLQAVQELARNKNVTLPTAPDAQHRAMADKLNGLSGDAFDRAYLQGAGVSDHQAAHKLLAQADKRARDPDVKALVEKLQPVVEHHLDEVRPLAKNKGGSL
jgi:putative membrane protein